MLELLAPAGSPEGLRAAVQSGADAVYLGFGGFNARKNAKNFTEEELRRATAFCRIRGVKVYVTLNTLATDRELAGVAELAQTASDAGVSAILVQDLGVLRALQAAVPHMPLHASTQMSLHSLDGVKMAADLGLTRAVLARELPRRELEYIAGHAPIETEVFVHGALCMSYSGQCYMSALIGRRSGNRGLCAQPCRLSYRMGKSQVQYPLSLRDNCLIRHLQELDDMGVSCVKIEGRMKRPEYAAIVTEIYARAIREGRGPTAEEMETLERAFSRQGFTDGYFTGTKENMFGIRQEADKGEIPQFAQAKNRYTSTEYQRVPVKFYAMIQEGKPAQLAVSDEAGHVAKAQGPLPEVAFHQELDKDRLQSLLGRTGGTPYICQGLQAVVEPGLYLPVSAVNDLRRQVLDTLSAQRAQFTPPEKGEFHPGLRLLNLAEPPAYTVSVLRADQLSKGLAEAKPAILYLPVEEFLAAPEKLRHFEGGDTEICVALPRVAWDSELPALAKKLLQTKAQGVETVLAGNLGQIRLAKALGFRVRGDFGLNVFNSQALRTLKALELESATLSFELMLGQIRDVSKCLDTELIVYGRLPLMLTENCIIKNAMGRCACDNLNHLSDRKGAEFPVRPTAGCRSQVLNSHKLFLADREGDYAKLGLRYARLSFTTENAKECLGIVQTYLGYDYYAPNEFTRGLYYRGVE